MKKQLTICISSPSRVECLCRALGLISYLLQHHDTTFCTPETRERTPDFAELKEVKDASE